MGRIIPYIMENEKCSQPPTSHYMFWLLFPYGWFIDDGSPF
jgi:hypothetical protein